MKHKLILFVFLLATLPIVHGQASGRKKYNFNSEWKLQIGDFPKAKEAGFDDSGWKQVTLPRPFNEDEAFKVSIEQLTDTVVWYRKHFRIPELKTNQKVFIEFEGVRTDNDWMYREEGTKTKFQWNDRKGRRRSSPQRTTGY